MARVWNRIRQLFLYIEFSLLLKCIPIPVVFDISAFYCVRPPGLPTDRRTSTSRNCNVHTSSNKKKEMLVRSGLYVTTLNSSTAHFRSRPVAQHHNMPYHTQYQSPEVWPSHSSLSLWGIAFNKHTLQRSYLSKYANAGKHSVYRVHCTYIVYVQLYSQRRITFMFSSCKFCKWKKDTEINFWSVRGKTEKKVHWT